MSARRRPGAPPRATPPGRVRVQGGRWRGRWLPVPPLPGLRPTPDRVRQTLFDWLRPLLPGTRCLDLYAGTGALGIEAVSQGAAEALLIEREPAAAAALRQSVARLDAASLRVIEADALAWLATRPGRFDIVFIDPPYSSKLVQASCRALVGHAAVGPGSLVFAELGAEGEDALPEGWRVRKRARAGAVSVVLAEVGVAGEPPENEAPEGGADQSDGRACGGAA